MLQGLIAAGAAPAPPAWENRPGYRFAPVSPATPGKTGFTALAGASVGLTFTNSLADERSATNRNLLSGAGLAAGDADGDGWCDLYFCGLDSDNRLFRNLGNGRFEDVTSAAGVACPGQDSTGATFADVDGDSDLDLLVAALGNGVRLFLNDGRGRFSEATGPAGLSSKVGSISIAAADIDADGDLDLYVANYRTTTLRDRPTTTFKLQRRGSETIVIEVDGQPTTLPGLTNRFAVAPNGEVIEHSEPSDLFLNDGTGRFARASWTDGRFLDEEGRALKEVPQDWSLTARFHDFTGDGAPDLAVCNDLFSPDRIWVNDGRGHFRALPRLALRHTSSFSMGMDFGDLNRDGHVDFYVVDMVSRDLRERKIQTAGLSPMFSQPGAYANWPQVFQNTLQINRGDGTFAELACYAGLDASGWSWQPAFLDVDLDGFEDILVVNGMLRDFQNADMGGRINAAVSSGKVTLPQLVGMFRSFPGLFIPKILFRNRRDLTFEETGAAWGFDGRAISQGLALADLDHDGDLDAVCNNLNDGPTLYRNDSTAPRLLVRLKGRAPNTQAIGARLLVRGGPVDQSQEIICGGRYLSADDPVRVFAAGRPEARLTLEVTWRSGQRTLLENLAPGRVEIDEATAPSSPSTPAPRPPSPLFEDLSDRLNHVHHETVFDDFSRQLLLPRQHSQPGPGLSWIDVDQDGADDLVIGAGRGGRPAVFRNLGQGRFEPLANAALDTPVPRDLTTLLALPRTNGTPLLLAGSSNYEDGQKQGAVARTYDLASASLRDELPGQRGSTGPMSLADIDGDGDLDLFVGGRVIPGRFPEPAASFLFLNQAGRFELDPTNRSRFVGVGLVSGSVFADLDLDGDPDLALACEWGPVRVFRNDQGAFTEVTAEWGLAPHTGWWNGINAVDLDGDGRLDLVASNWGLNTRYRASPQSPRRIYFGDLNGAGIPDIIESCIDPASGQYTAERDFMAMATGLPYLRDRYASHEDFAKASVDDLIGGTGAKVSYVQVTELRSMAFLNRTNAWELRPLPAEAQFSPAFGVGVGDFDGDGHEDVVLSQNFFASEPFTRRDDAGLGLLLCGDGQGSMRPVPATESGIRVYGEQRGVAVADFDADGRPDIAIGQNASQTVLLRNTLGKKGLRVKVAGGIANPSGVGTVVRLRFGDRLGPARQISAGSGYWSQDSAVVVMGGSSVPTDVWAKLVGGKEVTVPVPAGANEIVIPADRP